MYSVNLPDYETEAELCARLGIHPRTLMRWRTRGEAPPRTVLPGGKAIYRRAATDAWLASLEDRQAS